MQNDNTTIRDDVRSYALELLCELMTDDDFLVALKRVTDSASCRSTISYLDDDIVAANHQSTELKRNLIDVIRRGGFDR